METKGSSKRRFLRLVALVGMLIAISFVAVNSLRTSEIYIDDYVAQGVASGKLCFSDVEFGREWNRMLILEPYDKIDNYGLDVRFVDRKVINRMAMFDSCCTIAFLQDNKLVAYTHVPRSLLDLSPKGGRFYDKGHVFGIE